VVNQVMDDLAEMGVRAILTSEIRSCRAVDGRIQPYPS
jgi:ATP phosphoribosyltransferase